MTSTTPIRRRARRAGHGHHHRSHHRSRRPVAVRHTHPPHQRVLRRRPRTPRLPFDLLVVVLLGVGLMSLLALNTAAAEQSFRSHQLEAEKALLADRAEALEMSLERDAAPSVLAARATRLGMRPVDAPRYLRLAAAGASPLLTPPPTPTPTGPAPRP